MLAQKGLKPYLQAVVERLRRSMLRRERSRECGELAQCAAAKALDFAQQANESDVRAVLRVEINLQPARSTQVPPRNDPQPELQLTEAHFCRRTLAGAPINEELFLTDVRLVQAAGRTSPVCHPAGFFIFLRKRRTNAAMATQIVCDR